MSFTRQFGLKLARFFALPLWQQAAFPLVWLLLGCYRLALITVSWRFLSRNMRLQAGDITHSLPDPRQLAHARDVGSLVALASRYTPWNSQCLVQVMATRRLLVMCAIPYEIHFGVQAVPLAVADGLPANIAAHAWLSCGDHVVIGGSGHTEYKELCRYAGAAVSG